MKNLEDTVNALKALGDATRYRILDCLLGSGNNLCVNALSMKLEIAQPVISQHLKILRNAGLVNSSKIGYHVHYAASESRIREIEGRLNELFNSCARECTGKDCKRDPE